MVAFLNDISRHSAEFLSSNVKRRLLLIVVLAVAAAADFCFLGLARRTFVFYNVDNGVIVVEDRMLKHSSSREEDIIRYTEEALLGPAAPDLLPLFPRGTRLKSLLYRNEVVYADLSPEAALPPEEGGRVIDNFKTLETGILRNFSYVKDVRFFIEGNAVLFGEFPPGQEAEPENFSDIE
jgi:hypothetical protein